MNFSSYLEETRIQSPDLGIISEQAMSEKQFGQKRQSMEKEIRGSRLVPESEFLDCRKQIHITLSTTLNILNMETLKRALRFQTVKKI